MIAERTSHTLRSVSLPSERTHFSSPSCDGYPIPTRPACVTSLGMESSRKGGYPKPSLDENRSPFNGNLDFVPRFASDMSRNSSLSPCMPQSAPHPGRRPRGKASLKLPPLDRSKQEQTKPQKSEFGDDDYEDETIPDRGCRTAPARHHPHLSSFFPPTPPLTTSASRSHSSPRSKRHRNSAKSQKSQLTGMNLKDYMTGSSYTPGAYSSKSAQSRTTASTTDMPDLNFPVSPIMDTPAASSVMLSARAAVDTPATNARYSTSPPSSTTSTVSRISRWKKGEKIGVGSHGAVFKALNLSNGHIFVVKESIVNDKDYHDKLKVELDICKDLVHHNIVRCLGHECIEHHLYVQLEYISGGSLKGFLSEFGALDVELMPQAMRHLLEGLRYLHSRSPPVVHRDIKSANVLVGQDFCLKLADFGCSKRDDITTSFTTTGSVLWMAPEVIRGNKGGHGRKADIWSLGCVFIEMATAEKPWGEKAFDNILQAMRHIEGSESSPAIPNTLPAPAHDLITQCVQRDPHHRPKASELLAHEFIRRANT